jgi:tRNA dimethylallyltransferase
VQHLRNQYQLAPRLSAMRAVGYRQVWDHLDGNFDRKELVARGTAATRQLAKRQLTWLRAMSNLIVFDCLEKKLATSVADFAGLWLKGQSFRAE